MEIPVEHREAWPPGVDLDAWQQVDGARRPGPRVRRGVDGRCWPQRCALGAGGRRGRTRGSCAGRRPARRSARRPHGGRRGPHGGRRGPHRGRRGPHCWRRRGPHRGRCAPARRRGLSMRLPPQRCPSPPPPLRMQRCPLPLHRQPSSDAPAAATPAADAAAAAPEPAVQPLLWRRRRAPAARRIASGGAASRPPPPHTRPAQSLLQAFDTRAFQCARIAASSFLTKNWSSCAQAFV